MRKIIDHELVNIYNDVLKKGLSKKEQPIAFGDSKNGVVRKNYIKSRWCFYAL